MRSYPITTLVAGVAAGPVRLLSRPLSLWGGYDVTTGNVIDATHPDLGLNLAGQIMAMPEARGSSSSSSALVEAVRCGVAPSAIIIGRLDPILVMGGLVAKSLYGVALPIVVLDDPYWGYLFDSVPASISTEEQRLTLEV